jgi:hypothetical protein
MSIAVVAYGRDHDAEIDLREVGFYLAAASSGRDARTPGAETVAQAAWPISASGAKIDVLYLSS